MINYDEVFENKLKKASAYYPGKEQVAWLIDSNLSTESANILYGFIKYCDIHKFQNHKFYRKAIDAVLNFERR